MILLLVEAVLEQQVVAPMVLKVVILQHLVRPLQVVVVVFTNVKRHQLMGKADLVVGSLTVRERHHQVMKVGTPQLKATVVVMVMIPAVADEQAAVAVRAALAAMLMVVTLV
jgi:hypothetical protein